VALLHPALTQKILCRIPIPETGDERRADLQCPVSTRQIRRAAIMRAAAAYRAASSVKLIPVELPQRKRASLGRRAGR